MLLGGKKYTVVSDSFGTLYNEISKRKIPVQDMQENNGRLTLKVSFRFCRGFEKLCREKSYEFESAEEKGLITVLRSFMSRSGLVAGAVVTVAALAVVSNIAVRIEIQNDNPDTCEKIREVLKAEGISAGKYIPSMDFTKAENAVRSSVDEIAWIGISIRGSGLVVDTLDYIKAEENTTHKLPCNLISTENGVIEKIEVFDGQVKLGVGCGVVKGDVLVSGEVVTTDSQWIDGKEITETNISYTRSIGAVYGTFERKIAFEQPFEERCEYLTGTESRVHFLNIFSADIPLFYKMPEGYYKSECEYENIPEIFGLTFPVGVTTVSLEEYYFRTEILTEQQARDAVEEKAYLYEKNFLGEYEIKDRKSEITVTDSGVTQTVTYTLYGKMSKEAEFFIPKS
jgi:similar to stage IV sporulation protein